MDNKRFLSDVTFEDYAEDELISLRLLLEISVKPLLSAFSWSQIDNKIEVIKEVIHQSKVYAGERE